MKGLRSILTGPALAALCLLLIVLFSAGPGHAQALLAPGTTTTSAITATQTTIPLAAVSSITANNMYGWLDHELVEIATCDTASLTCVVTRGRQGTSARSHPTSSRFVFGVRSSLAWQVVDPDIKASCGTILTWINIRTGTIFTCTLSSVWRGNNIIPIVYDSISLTR